jgi:hypothetical protein
MLAGVKGCATVSFGLLLAAFISPHAGRVSESGTGAMWVAPELVATHAGPAQPCAQSAALRAKSLVFETIERGASFDEARLASAAREVVSFEWNPATGELSFSTSAPTGVFKDLAASSPAYLRSAPNCGSR